MAKCQGFAADMPEGVCWAWLGVLESTHSSENRFVQAGAGHLPPEPRLGLLPSGKEEEEPKAAMKWLSRLLYTAEDAMQGAEAASHDGRECVGSEERQP